MVEILPDGVAVNMPVSIDALTRVVADETIRLRPFGSVTFQRGEEDEHQHGEETGQEGIEDDVEHQNLNCAKKIRDWKGGIISCDVALATPKIDGRPFYIQTVASQQNNNKNNNNKKWW